MGLAAHAQQEFPEHVNRRVLVVDDNPSIHEDFRKILSLGGGRAALEDLERELFGKLENKSRAVPFEIDSANQGQLGLERVARARREGRPYALAFIDIRMPPGWDGLETAARIWMEDPQLQIVICTAYSDYSWSEMVKRLGETDQLLILKKPFDTIEVLQLAYALTAKWALVDERRRRVEDLEAAVNARTRELQLANARLSDEMARRQGLEVELRRTQRLEALGRLSEGVAHEINNPLAVLIGNLGFIDEELANLASLSGAPQLEETRAAIHDAELGAERIKRIVLAMSSFAQVRSRPASPIDLGLPLERAVKASSAELAAHHCELRYHQPSPLVMANAPSLEQLLVQLIGNAAQAMPASRPGADGQGSDGNRIEVTARAGAPGFVVVEVADNGQGIAPENVERIFDPFFTTRPIGSHIGLGLSLCHEVVTGLGGTITVESTLGHGAVFRVSLPAGK